MIDTSPYEIRRHRSQWALVTPDQRVILKRATQRQVISEYLAKRRAGELSEGLDPGGLRHGYHIGITGTRTDPLPHQQHWLEHNMVQISEDLRARGIGIPGQAGSEIVYFHHGDCVGVDKFSHHIARALRWPIIVHPPREHKYRAFCKPVWMICEEMGYLARNRVMVGAISLLLSVPKDPITLQNAKGYGGAGISGTSYTTTLGLTQGLEVRICPIKDSNGLQGERIGARGVRKEDFDG